MVRLKPRFAANFSDVLTPLLAGLLYFALAAITIRETTNGRTIATVWPPDAVLLAWLLIRHRSRWWSILAAGFVANVAANWIMRGTIAGAPLFAVANMVGVTVAVLGLRYRVTGFSILRDPTTLWRFIFWAGLGGPATASLIGATTAAIAFKQNFWEAFATWLTADSLGLLIVTPFLFAVFRGDYTEWLRENGWKKKLEAAALMLLIAATALIVFNAGRYPVLFVVAIPMMLVTFRLGWMGTKLGVVIIAAIGAIATMHHTNMVTLASPDPWFQAAFFQFFLACLLLLNMPVAAALAARKELVNQLEESERSLRVFADQSPILLLSFDMEGVCQKAMGASQSLLARDANLLIGRSFAGISAEDHGALQSAHETVLRHPENRQVVELHLADDGAKWLEAAFSIALNHDGGCAGTLATIHDITVRKQQEFALSRSAVTDSLTGLLNRAGFMASLSQMVATASDEVIGLAMIDVDRFKLINDNAGHQAGDAVLKEIATRIGKELRSADIVGRLGGDEFVILLMAADWDEMQDICNRVVTQVSSARAELPSGGSLRMSISCGLAQYRADMTAEDFLHEADVALYVAKRGGRNQVIVA